MAHVRARLALIACVAACGVRPPPPVDVTHLERRDLVARVLANPRDVQAHLALATLADRLGRPGEALAQLQIVETLGGPLGVRWHAEDRARMAGLLIDRAAERRARGAPTALADVDHARALGAAVRGHDVAASKLAVAIAELRHSDAEQRANGRAILAELATLPEAQPDGAWRGAMPSATPDEHGRLGIWLWEVGARREAYEQLELWKRTSAQAGPILDAYERAHAWWSGSAGAAPAQAVPLAPSAVSAAPAVPHAAAIVIPDDLIADAPIVAAARYAHARFAGAPTEALLLAVAREYRREPVVADRLGADLVAAQVDEAAGHAALGALFDALGDPARARIEWQAAVDGSPEPAFVRGLAEAIARTGDASAALIFATQAAAAWGDPAVVWISVGDVLESVGAHVDALVCAHSAVDLAGPDQLPRALDLAIAASHALGRQTQVEALRVQRVAAEPPHAAESPRATPEPTDPAAAILAYHTLPTAGTIARMWVAARAHPRDLEVRLALLGALPADDPRRATVIADLVELAGDPDPERGLAAALAISARGR